MKADAPRGSDVAGRAARAPATPEQDLACATHQHAQGPSLLELSDYFSRSLELAQIDRLQQGSLPPLAHALVLARAERQFADPRQRRAPRRAALHCRRK